MENGFLALFNIFLAGVAVTFALKIYADLKKTSLARPIAAIGLAFVLIMIHEALNFAGLSGVLMLNDEGLLHAEHSLPSMLVESAFAVMLFIGVRGFQRAFEKFEWVNEVTRGQSMVLPEKK